MTSTDADPQATETPDAPSEAPVRYPWYSLNPRALKGSKLMRAILVGLLLGTVTIVPVWRALWYLPLLGGRGLMPVRDVTGHYRQAWRWVEGREIRVYAAPGLPPGQAETIARGARMLIDEVGLDFTVRVLPMPDPIRQAAQASMETKMQNGVPCKRINFGKLESRLITLRDGDPHADMLVLDAPFHDTASAHGVATINGGVAVLQSFAVDEHLGKHETGHLVGYLSHDNLPFFVIGYPWEGSPMTRDTLMMLYGHSMDLSPRACDALHYFWRGMEDRLGEHYLK